MQYIIIGEHLDILGRQPRFETIGPFESEADAAKYITEHFVTEPMLMAFHVVPMYDPEKFHEEQMQRA